MGTSEVLYANARWLDLVAEVQLAPTSLGSGNSPQNEHASVEPGTTGYPRMTAARGVVIVSTNRKSWRAKIRGGWPRRRKGWA